MGKIKTKIGIFLRKICGKTGLLMESDFRSVIEHVMSTIRFGQEQIDLHSHEYLNALQVIKSQNDCISLKLEQLEKQIEQQSQQVVEIIQTCNFASDVINATSTQVATILGNQKQENQLVENTKRTIELIKLASDEMLWAEIFNSTVNDSKWLTNKTFSPGRWAVGYPYLYVMYRVLNEFRPKNILEFGLGQSTRMMAQYAHSADISHTIVEQDMEWISFFRQNYEVPNQSCIKYLPVKEIQFLDDDRCLVYDGLAEIVEGQRNDFISIDGPAHSRSEKYRRVDICNIIPDILADSFVILLDDIDLPTCKATLNVIFEKLKECGIAYTCGNYRGQKDVTVVCSSNLSFLCSM